MNNQPPPKISAYRMRPYRDLQDLHDSILDLVYANADQVSLAEALRVLDSVKRSLMEASMMLARQPEYE